MVIHNFEYHYSSGTIPKEIARLHNMQDLRLDSNKLSGPIPREVGNMKALVKLWLNSNSLSGMISFPHKFSNIMLYTSS